VSDLTELEALFDSPFLQIGIVRLHITVAQGSSPKELWLNGPPEPHPVSPDSPSYHPR